MRRPRSLSALDSIPGGGERGRGWRRVWCDGKMSGVSLVWAQKNPSPFRSGRPAQPREASYKTKPTGPSRVTRARLPLARRTVPPPKPFLPPPPPPPAKPFLPPPRAGHGARCGSNPRPPHLLQPKRGFPRALLRGRPHQGMGPY
jgi:hypothetical protein